LGGLSSFSALARVRRSRVYAASGPAEPFAQSGLSIEVAID